MARTSAFAKRALVTTAAAAVALLALAIPASAHEHDVKADCNKAAKVTWLKVNLDKYVVDEGRSNNTVVVTDNGKVLLDEEFTNNFYADWGLAELKPEKHRFAGLDATIDHDLKVEVTDNGDKESKNREKYTFTWSPEPNPVKACVDKPTSSSQPTTTTTTKPSTPSSSNAAAATTTTEAAVGASANLASTGASIAIPLGIAALLLIGGGAMLVLVRRRNRA
jgi:LPXTG-motif cell wall-anchored protein